jgi:tetraacyldisaccharide 4'-kinase
VISIGNITVGGSGKTPLVEVTARAARELGERPAVVSRGYGRRSRGVQVVADSEGIHLSPRVAGDEPYLLASRLPGTPVVVGENRYQAARVAAERCGATLIVLDDGFQHRTLAKDLEVLVLNARAPWGNGRLFPRGSLREPLAALRRAHVIILTNPHGPSDLDAVTDVIRRHGARAPVVTASYGVSGLREGRTGRQAMPGALAGRRVIAFAGLASPRGFAETVAGLGAEIEALVEFPDHYWYGPDDLRNLSEQAHRPGCAGLITTEKDWVRLHDLPPVEAPLWVLEVVMRIETNETTWREALARAIRGGGGAG